MSLANVRLRSIVKNADLAILERLDSPLPKALEPFKGKKDTSGSAWVYSVGQRDHTTQDFHFGILSSPMLQSIQGKHNAYSCGLP